MTDLVEAVAFAMWKEEADRAAPNVGKNRTPEGFLDESEAVRSRWQGLAKVAVATIADRISGGIANARRMPVAVSAEPQVLELHVLDREEPIRVSVPDGTGFCRKCGAPMAEGIAMGQTYVGGMPDFPGDTHSSTFSAGGPGEVIRALKCTACGWSVT